MATHACKHTQRFLYMNVFAGTQVKRMKKASVSEPRAYSVTVGVRSEDYGKRHACVHVIPILCANIKCARWI